MFLVLGAFFKFRYRVISKRENNLFYVTVLALFAMYYTFFPFSPGVPGISFLTDLTVLLAAVFGSRWLFFRLERFSRLDTMLVFRNLNVELLLIAVLFFVEMVFLRIVVF
jgi:hypothetical protein